MSEQQYRDPSGNTEQFRAFVQATEPATPGRSMPTGVIVGAVAVAVVLAALIAWLATA